MESTGNTWHASGWRKKNQGQTYSHHPISRHIPLAYSFLETPELQAPALSAVEARLRWIAVAWRLRRSADSSRHKTTSGRNEHAVEELVVRFIVGGIVGSVCAPIGSCLKPRIFTGLFGAAPSVALATIGLSITAQGENAAGFAGTARARKAAGKMPKALLWEA